MDSFSACQEPDSGSKPGQQKGTQKTCQRKQVQRRQNAAESTKMVTKPNAPLKKEPRCLHKHKGMLWNEQWFGRTNTDSLLSRESVQNRFLPS